MRLFDFVFFMLFIDFFAVIVFLAKAFSRINRSKFERYKYLGPFALFISGALDKTGRFYMVLAILLALIFFLGFGYLSSSLESA